MQFWKILLQILDIPRYPLYSKKKWLPIQNIVYRYCWQPCICKSILILGLDHVVEKYIHMISKSKNKILVLIMLKESTFEGDVLM